jgi:hypothetical protein
MHARQAAVAMIGAGDEMDFGREGRCVVEEELVRLRSS